MYEDLRWFGLEWDEGPDRGGPFGPYKQSERMDLYRAAFEKLKLLGFIYPCFCSRQDVLRSIGAPHAGEDEPIYPGTCRPGSRAVSERAVSKNKPRANWRFQVPDGETITFVDGRMGAQNYVAGSDFGDFVVWRQDNLPAYQLAVVVDDAAMKISEVVRGEDLLKSTARQILLYNALGLRIPAYYHCALVRDESGERLAKRHDSLSLRTLRQQGVAPETLRPGSNS
jgi:glutamyl-tRNA synthetase